MDLLNRDLQRRLLKELAEIYPSPANMQRSFKEDDERQVQYNLFYLSEHGLVDVKATKLLSGDYPIHSATITARGIDFISDDGGLSAILGVVTVKLHEETIKSLLMQKIDEAPGNETVKASLKERIKGMPAEALSTVTQRALESGLDQIPDLIGSLSKWLGL